MMSYWPVSLKNIDCLFLDVCIQHAKWIPKNESSDTYISVSVNIENSSGILYKATENIDRNYQSIS